MTNNNQFNLTADQINNSSYKKLQSLAKQAKEQGLTDVKANSKKQVLIDALLAIVNSPSDEEEVDSQSSEITVESPDTLPTQYIEQYTATVPKLPVPVKPHYKAIAGFTKQKTKSIRRRENKVWSDIKKLYNKFA